MSIVIHFLLQDKWVLLLGEYNQTLACEFTTLIKAQQHYIVLLVSYDFYNNMNIFKEPLDDLYCCKANTTTTESSFLLPSTSDLVDDIPEENESDVDIEIDLPVSKSI